MSAPYERLREIRGGGETKIPEESSFPHREVEARWNNIWLRNNIYAADDESPRPPFSVIDMFPYPSGEGLHVGHVEGYTASDILARFMRMQGLEVLHPMGWDAFGLPTENYAIRENIDPREVTERNIATFRNQCIRTGLGIDWLREIDTSSPEYYKWTQWIFLQLYRNRLAYKAEAPANWCGGCQTTIADEQVRGGHCERCSSPVEMRNVEQWLLRITEFAEELLEGLKDLDWPKSTKEMQRKWIGKTEGYDLRLAVDAGSEITVFTPTPELLQTTSFIEISPLHPQLEQYIAEESKDEVLKFARQVRTNGDGEEEDGIFTGRYVINPLTGEQIPIWVRQGAKLDFGGIRLGLPNQDEGDLLFARKHGLDIKTTRGKKLRKKALAELGDLAENKVRYRLRDWVISRDRYWGAPIPIINCEACGMQPVPEDQLPVILPDVDDYRPTGMPPLMKSPDFINTTCPHCAGPAQREAKTLDTFVDSSWYYLRYADPHNDNEFASQELLKRWLPVAIYIGGAEHARGHLLYARFITRALNKLGYVPFTEPFRTLRHQGMILGEDRQKMSKRFRNVVDPRTVADEYGADTLRLFEMFLGPLEQEKPWNTEGIKGPRRFIDKVWRLRRKITDEEPSPEEQQLVDSLILAVNDHIDKYRFNRAVSDFMEFVNEVQKLGRISRDTLGKFILCFAPFAPYISEEMWARLGHVQSIHLEQWPRPEMKVVSGAEPNPILVTIGGKKRIGQIRLPQGFSGGEDEVLRILRNDPRFAHILEEKEVKRVVFVPGRVINIVLE